MEFLNGHAIVTLAAAAGAGGVLGLANPTGDDLLVEVVLEVVTGVGALTADCGIAANATTSADNLLDGVSIAAASPGKKASASDGGTNGKPKKVWKSDQFLTISASADPAGLVGYLHIWAEKITR